MDWFKRRKKEITVDLSVIDNAKKEFCHNCFQNLVRLNRADREQMVKEEEKKKIEKMRDSLAREAMMELLAYHIKMHDNRRPFPEQQRYLNHIVKLSYSLADEMMAEKAKADRHGR